MSGALKWDNGKMPWELLPFDATEGALRVLLYGKRKYSTCGDCHLKWYKNPRLDGDPETDTCWNCGSKNLFSGSHNWRQGFNWSRLIGSTYRHMKAFVTGNDFDDESGELHIHQVIVNAMFLAEHVTKNLGKDDRYKG